MGFDLPSARADWMLIDARNPMLCPIWGSRDDVKSEMRVIFNKRFGSCFRAAFNPTQFAFSLHRYCDLYTASIDNCHDHHDFVHRRFYPCVNVDFETLTLFVFAFARISAASNTTARARLSTPFPPFSGCARLQLCMLIRVLAGACDPMMCPIWVPFSTVARSLPHEPLFPRGGIVESINADAAAGRLPPPPPRRSEQDPETARHQPAKTERVGTVRAR